MSVFIIAEAGVNHNGSIDLAKKMIDVASDAGADAIKFQTFKAENLLTKDAKKAQYQTRNTNPDESQFDMIKNLELNDESHKELFLHCSKKKIIFLSSPFDLCSVTLLNNIGLEIFKIPSGEITNLPYLRQIGKLNKKIILSTGMSQLSEIKDALDVLIHAGTKKDNIIILHANTEYPTPMQDVNLRAMLTIGASFKVAYGYSDHTLGIEVGVAAVALGATCIEKHFTLSRDMDGPDHSASIEPHELKKMIESIRNIEKALGSSEKKPSKSEALNMHMTRKSIVASRDISKGEEFNANNLTVKRPGDGISPMEWDDIIGTNATKDYSKDELI